MRIGARVAGSEGSGGRGHLSERPGWPSGAPISRGSTVSIIAFGGRRGPGRSGSRCRGRPIERREAGREGCASGRMPLPRAPAARRLGLESVKASARALHTSNGRAKTLCGGGGGAWCAHQLRITRYTSGRLPRILGSDHSSNRAGYRLNTGPAQLLTQRIHTCDRQFRCVELNLNA